MRLLHLDSGREMRGGQWQVLYLLERLEAECTLLARQGSPLFTAARERGLRIEPLGAVRAAALSRQHDLIHAHDARSHTLAALIPGTRAVVSRRVAFPIQSPWKYARAERYLAVSAHVMSVLITGGVPAEKVDVVYDGVPLRDLPPVEDVVIAPATDDPQKGTQLAVEAAKLAGVELELSRDLRRRAICLYLTHSEGLGSGALLAMSAGAAVVASNVGGIPEVIRDRENGLLVPNEPVAIAAALRELRGDPTLVRRLGEAARRTVEERFTVDRMVSRTMEIYRQVLK
jgi:glycosyltransferase involved in cell wall biosynthesis